MSRPLVMGPSISLRLHARTDAEVRERAAAAGKSPGRWIADTIERAMAAKRTSLSASAPTEGGPRMVESRFKKGMT